MKPEVTEKRKILVQLLELYGKEFSDGAMEMLYRIMDDPYYSAAGMLKASQIMVANEEFFSMKKLIAYTIENTEYAEEVVERRPPATEDDCRRYADM